MQALAQLTFLDKGTTPRSAVAAALRTAPDTGDLASKQLRGLAYYAFGLRNRWIDSTTLAIAYLDSARSLFSTVGDRHNCAYVDLLMGDIQTCLGNPGSAIRSLNEASRELMAMGDTLGAIEGYALIADVFRLQRNPVAAVEQITKALSLIGHEHPQVRLGLLTQLGALQVETGHPALVLELMEEAGALVSTGKAIDYLDQVSATTGEALLLQGKCADALALLNKSMERSVDRVDRRDMKAYLLARISRAKSCAGDHAAAYRSALQGEAISLHFGFAQMRLDNLQALVVACEGLGDLGQAYTWSKRYHALDDSLSNARAASAVSSALLTAEFKGRQVADSLINAQELQQAAVATANERKLRNIFLSVGLVLLAFGIVVFRQRGRIRKALRRSDELLLNILPREVAEELKLKGEAEAKYFDLVTILFTDFKGFTQLSEKVTPAELVAELNLCFKEFDLVMEKYRIEKIKTIGDAYMAAGGLPDPQHGSPADVVRAALEMQDFMKQHKAEREAAGKPFFEMRIGIHTGPVVAGIVGVKKFQYDIWGDTVNTASRMESSGEVGQVNISGATYALVKDVKKVNGEWSIANGGSSLSPTPIHHAPHSAHSPFANSHSPAFSFTPRGKVLAKGKGEMEMYFVERRQ